MPISPRRARIEYEAIRRDPFRETDWRYKFARRIVAQGSIQSLRPIYDDALKEVAQFLRVHRSLQRRYRNPRRSPEERRELFRSILMQHFPDMYTAYRIYTSHEEDPSRVELEARILANQPDSDIAPVTGFTERTIHLYEQCFFSVRDSLIVKRYIARVVLGPLLHPDTPRTWAFTVKYFGYFGGPALLDAFLDGVPNLQESGAIDDSLDVIHERQIKIGSILAGMRIPESINRFNLAEIVKAYDDLLDRKTRREALLAEANKGGPKSGFESVILSVLESIPWATGKPAESHLNAMGISGVNERARELRMNELLVQSTNPDQPLPEEKRLLPPSEHRQLRETKE
jgi:hypothetical protein